MKKILMTILILPMKKRIVQCIVGTFAYHAIMRCQRNGLCVGCAKWNVAQRVACVNVEVFAAIAHAGFIVKTCDDCLKRRRTSFNTCVLWQHLFLVRVVTSGRLWNPGKPSAKQSLVSYYSPYGSPCITPYATPYTPWTMVHTCFHGCTTRRVR